MVNNAALSSTFLLLLLLALGEQCADAFAAHPRVVTGGNARTRTHRLHAANIHKKGFGTSVGVGKSKKQKMPKKSNSGDVRELAPSSFTISPVMAAYELGARGAEMQRRGQLNGAVSAFTEALALHPTADRRFLLGMALEENGEPRKAVAMYELACESSDSGADAVLRHDAALKLADLSANDLGDVARAIQYVDKAMAEEGYDHSAFSNAAAFDQKAFYLAEQGHLVEAIGLWDAALEGTKERELVAETTSADSLGEDAVARAAARSRLGQFFRAVAKALSGHDREAEADFAALPADCQYMVESWNYIAAADYPREQRLQGVRQNGRLEVGHLFTGPYTVLQEALAASRSGGLVCEFGVFHGKSIRILASLVGPQNPVDGFDTFEGIPEAWGADPAGTYTAASEIPPVPNNVRFHVGLFSETLPGYVASLAPPVELPVRFINVDCDLYQGTVEILHHLAERIGPGCVICFDEYLMTPTWREDEHKAFQEACRKFDWEYEYLGFSLFSKQAVVRITASASFVGPLDMTP